MDNGWKGFQFCPGALRNSCKIIHFDLSKTHPSSGTLLPFHKPLRKALRLGKLFSQPYHTPESKYKDPPKNRPGFKDNWCFKRSAGQLTPLSPLGVNIEDVKALKCENPLSQLK